MLDIGTLGQILTFLQRSQLVAFDNGGLDSNYSKSIAQYAYSRKVQYFFFIGKSAFFTCGKQTGHRTVRYVVVVDNVLLGCGLF